MVMKGGDQANLVKVCYTLFSVGEENQGRKGIAGLEVYLMGSLL